MTILKVLILIIEGVYLIQGAVNNDVSSRFNNGINSNYSFEDDIDDDRYDISEDQSYDTTQLSDEEIRKVAQLKQLMKNLSLPKMVSAAAASDNIPKDVANKIKMILKNISGVMDKNGSQLSGPIDLFVYMLDNQQRMKKLNAAYQRAGNEISNSPDDYVTVDKYLSTIDRNLYQTNDRQFDDFDQDFGFDNSNGTHTATNIDQEQEVVDEMEKLIEYLPLAYTVYGASIDLPEKFRNDVLEKLENFKQRSKKLNSPLANVADFYVFVLTHQDLMRKMIRALSANNENDIVNYTVDEFFANIRKHVVNDGTVKPDEYKPKNVTQKTGQNAARFTNPYQHVPPLIGVMNATPVTATSPNIDINGITNAAGRTRDTIGGGGGTTNRFSLSDDTDEAVSFEEKPPKMNVMKMGEKRKKDSENTDNDAKTKQKYSTQNQKNGVETKTDNGLNAKPSIDKIKQTKQTLQPNKNQKLGTSNGQNKRTLPGGQTMKSGPKLSSVKTENGETSLEDFQSQGQSSNNSDSSEPTGAVMGSKTHVIRRASLPI